MSNLSAIRPRPESDALFEASEAFLFVAGDKELLNVFSSVIDDLLSGATAIGSASSLKDGNTDTSVDGITYQMFNSAVQAAPVIDWTLIPNNAANLSFDIGSVNIGYGVTFNAGVGSFGGAVDAAGLGLFAASPVTTQPAAIADATDATDVITQLNLLLAVTRTYGLIAT